MKNIFTILLCLAAYSYGFAQSPQSINYQAVIRNDAGIVVPNKAINIRFSIQEGITAPPQYVEIHQVTTNTVGLVNLPIGKGIIQSGTFAGINWGLGIKYLKTEVDVTGGTNFSLIGTQQFLSVPYAMYAEKSGNGANNWSLGGNTLTGNEFMGSLNNFPIIFKTNGAEKARLTEGGKLGLGVSNPTSWLSVQANGSGLSGTEDRVFLHLNNISTSSASSTNVHLTAGGSPNLTALTHHSPNYSVVSGYADYGQLASTGSGLVMQARNGILRFETGANGNGVFERMRIANNGNIGVGTSNPLYKMHLEAEATGFETGADPRSFIYIKNNSNSTASAAGITMSSGSNSGEGRLWHIAPTYSFRPQDQDFTTLYSSGRGISLWSSPKNNPNNGGYIKLQTGNKPDNTGGYDRLVINETGNIGIGTSNPSAQLHTTGSVLFSGIFQNNSLNKVIVADANGNLAWRDASTFGSSSTSGGWGLNGNSLTGNEFIGSNNNQPLVFRTNGVERARINESGKMGLGTSAPKANLSIEANADGLGVIENRVFLSLNNTSTSFASQAVAHLTAGGSSSLTSLGHVSPTYTVIPGYADFSLLASTGPGLVMQARNGILRFETGVNGNGVFERMRITNDGKIGIGTNAPLAQLHTTGSVLFSGILQNNSLGKIIVADGNGNLAWRDASTLTGSSSTGWGLSGNSLTGSEFIGSTNGQPIVFKTNGAERTRISSTGMVGVGTSNPLYMLHLEGEATGFESGADSRSFIFIKNNSNSTASAAGITMSSGTTSGEGRLWHIAPTYSLRPQDQDFTTLYSSGKGISLWSSPKSNPSNGGYMKFQTGVKPDNSGGYDRLVINELGNIGIGNSSPKAKVQVTDGDVYIDNATKGVIMKSPNGSCFRITVADNGTMVSTPIACPN